MFRRIFSNTITLVVIAWFVVAAALIITNPTGAREFFDEIFPALTGHANAEATAEAITTSGNTNTADKAASTQRSYGAVVDFFLDNSLARWFVFVTVVFAGLLLGRIVAAILSAIGRNLKHRDWDARAHIPADLAMPAWLAVFTLGLQVGFTALKMNAATTAGAVTTVQFLYSLAAFWYVYKLVGVVEVGLHRIGNVKEIRIDLQLIAPIRKTLRVVVVVIAVLFIVSVVFDYNVRAWLAGLGIAGLAVSLAAQDSLKNLFGSITILIDRPFRVGERIVYSGYDGVIEEIGFRSTTVRTGTGHLVSIPNSSIVNGSVENIGRRPFIRRNMDIGITYDTPRDKIEEAVQIVKNLLEEEGIREPIHQTVNGNEFPPRVFFNDMLAASLNITVLYWYAPPDYWDYMEHAQRLNLRIFEEFERAQIEFAFPTQTLYLAGDERRRLAVEMLGRDVQEGSA